ncbi:hypothetical protein Acsp02_45670 [Actinoplanes sp. NBRC 103695]|nr:hypothetical protein Acsp02_45670 [Actinoplanes sp. NBRC 103695]
MIEDMDPDLRSFHNGHMTRIRIPGALRRPLATLLTTAAVLLVAVGSLVIVSSDGLTGAGRASAATNDLAQWSPGPGPVQPWPFRNLVSDWQGRCVDVPNADFNDGVHLQMWGCDHTWAQDWHYVIDSDQGTYKLETLDFECMDVAGGSGENGTPVQIVGCNNGPAQQWKLTGAGDLVNPQSNKCLDIRDWNPHNGAALQIWDCAGTANQKWHFA